MQSESPRDATRELHFNFHKRIFFAELPPRACVPSGLKARHQTCSPSPVP